MPEKKKLENELPEDDRIQLELGEQLTFRKEEFEGLDIMESQRFKNPDGSARQFGIIYFSNGQYLIVPLRVAKRLEKIVNEGNWKEITIARGTKGFGKYMVFVK